MAIEGALEDVSLADICQLLSLGRKTGCLSVTDRSNFGYIFFEDGRVTYASVLNRPDRLGEVLVRNEVITQEALNAAVEGQAGQPGLRLGQILIDQESLSEEDLNRYISVQIEEAVYHMFGWTEGTFHFDSDQKPEEEGAFLVSINPESLLMEGARRVDEWGLIEKKIPAFDLVFALEKDPLEEEDVELTEAQRKVLPLIDGQRTVQAMIDESGLVEFEAAKALYGLIQAGFAESIGRSAAEEGAGEEPEVHHHRNLGDAFYKAGMLEDAEREYLAALQLELGSVEIRSRLALIALKGKRPEEALVHFESIPEGSELAYAGLRNRALVLELLGRFGEALDVLSAAAAANPSDEDVQLHRGIVQLKAESPESAVASFERYRTQLGDAPPPPIYYAFAVLAQAIAGEPDKAVLLGREGLSHYPSEGAILVNVGVILERQGEGDAAEALYLRAIADSPPPPQAHKNLGDLAYRRGDQADARAHFERAVQLEPALGDDIYMKLGNLAYKENDTDWAMLLWQRAIELNPNNEVASTNLETLAAALKQ